MNMKLGLLFAAIGTSTAGFAQIVNGNFDTTSGWDVLDCDFGGYNGAITHTADGSGSVWMNSNGTGLIPRVEQTLSGLTIGDTYTISFWTRTGALFSNNDVILGKIDGVTLLQGPNSAINEWTQLSLAFMATNTSALLSVQAEVVGDSDWRVDDFNVTSVPEPGSIAAFGVAGLALLGRKLRRK